MSYVKTKGIVIREVNTGEADKILTVFTKNHGKLSVAARGARRSRSGMVAGTQLLCYSDFVLFKGKELYTINSCETIETFYDIRNDVVKLTYAAHILELINDAVQDNQPAYRILQLLLNTLFYIANGRPPELVTRVFEIRLMAALGFSPSVKSCIECGNDVFDGISFSFRRCGLLCSKSECSVADPAAMVLLPGTVRALRHIICAKIEELFSFNVSDDVLRELSAVSRRYLKDRMEKDNSKLDFLKSL
jgi:DNA repair protein RecO (recombination protein O)